MTAIRRWLGLRCALMWCPAKPTGRYYVIKCTDCGKETYVGP